MVHNNDMHYNGRIWVFWNPRVFSLTVIAKSSQHIHCSLLHHASQKHFEVTFVYAFNVRGDRKLLWQHLQNISHQVLVPWVCMGDFNVVLKMDERLGSDHIHLADMQEFGQCLDTCGLVDHPATGSHFTWNNKQGNGLRWAKLDRILVSQSWFSTFQSTASFLNASVSDHSPCLLNVLDNGYLRRGSFKYLNCWALSPSFHKCVREGWDSHYYGGKISTLFQKLKRLKGFLRGIHSSDFSNLSLRVSVAKTELLSCQERLQTNPTDSSLISEEKELLTNYLLVKKAELQALHQRAKVQDLKANDACTRYFYSHLAARKATNSVGRILDINGGYIDIVSLIVMMHLSNFVLTKEIMDALKSIDRNKSPGLDGYSSWFLSRMPGLRWVLISRQQTLDLVIGHKQAAFVLVRDIFDNTMVAHELVSKYGRAYLTPRCLLKVDIGKALTLSLWGFLEIVWCN
ncbi:uncharacterized protein LOC141590352 [Silene latifolia]|uniref:uncharacterized protein LOC141590352 n=1 Tax=Silene latifolia TaxID=37657 RepID=UPI003D7898B0